MEYFDPPPSTSSLNAQLYSEGSPYAGSLGHVDTWLYEHLHSDETEGEEAGESEIEEPPNETMPSAGGDDGEPDHTAETDHATGGGPEVEDPPPRPPRPRIGGGGGSISDPRRTRTRRPSITWIEWIDVVRDEAVHALYSAAQRIRDGDPEARTILERFFPGIDATGIREVVATLELVTGALRSAEIGYGAGGDADIRYVPALAPDASLSVPVWARRLIEAAYGVNIHALTIALVDPDRHIVYTPFEDRWIALLATWGDLSYLRQVLHLLHEGFHYADLERFFGHHSGMWNPFDWQALVNELSPIPLTPPTPDPRGDYDDISDPEELPGDEDEYPFPYDDPYSEWWDDY